MLNELPFLSRVWNTCQGVLDFCVFHLAVLANIQSIRFRDPGNTRDIMEVEKNNEKVRGCNLVYANVVKSPHYSTNEQAQEVDYYQMLQTYVG